MQKTHTKLKYIQREGGFSRPVTAFAVRVELTCCYILVEAHGGYGIGLTQKYKLCLSVNAFKKNKRHLNHHFLLPFWLRMHFEIHTAFCYNYHAVSR